MPVIPGDPFSEIKSAAKPGQAPDPTLVNKFHARSDLDSSTEAQHHTLGVKANQASPGDHLHDGRNSKKLLALTGTPVAAAPATYNQTWGAQVVAALRALGAPAA